MLSSVLHVKKSKERRVDFSVAILFVAKWFGGEINVFQSCCGRIRASAKKDCNVSVPRILVVMSRTVTALFAASRVLGGDFVCGEIVWWRDKRISIVPWLGLANRRPLYIYSSTSVITRKGLVEKAVSTPRLQGDLYCGLLKSK